MATFRFFRKRLLNSGAVFATCDLVAACVSAPKQTSLMEEQGVVGMTATELQIWMSDFAIWYGGYMAEQAHATREQTDDPIIALNTARWLLYGVPTIHKTLFHTDPYLSPDRHLGGR